MTGFKWRRELCVHSHHISFCSCGKRLLIKPWVTTAGQEFKRRTRLYMKCCYHWLPIKQIVCWDLLWKSRGDKHESLYLKRNIWDAEALSESWRLVKSPEISVVSLFRGATEAVRGVKSSTGMKRGDMTPADISMLEEDESGHKQHPRQTEQQTVRIPLPAELCCCQSNTRISTRNTFSRNTCC